MCGGQLEHLATQLWFLEGSIYGCHDEAGHQGDADKSGKSPGSHWGSWKLKTMGMGFG